MQDPRLDRLEEKKEHLEQKYPEFEQTGTTMSMEKLFNKEDTDFKIKIQPNLAQNYFDIDDYYEKSFRG